MTPSPFATLQHFAMPLSMAQQIGASPIGTRPFSPAPQWLPSGWMPPPPSTPGASPIGTRPSAPSPSRPPAPPPLREKPSKDFINTVKDLPFGQILDAFHRAFPNQVPASPFDFFIRHISQNFPLPQWFFGGPAGGGGGGAPGGPAGGVLGAGGGHGPGGGVGIGGGFGVGF